MAGGVTSREATAYHEAGHVVALWMEFDPNAVHGASIVPKDEDNSLGRVQHRGVSIALDSQWLGAEDDELTQHDRMAHAAMHIVVLLAGREAEKWRTGRYNNVGADSDLHEVVDLASTVCGSDEEVNAFIRWLQIRAKRLIAFEANQIIIHAIARALLERETLTGDEIGEIVQQAMLDDLAERQRSKGVTA